MLPKAFYFPKATELSPTPETGDLPETEILSLAIDSNNFGWNDNYGNYVALGRLKPGATPAHAQAQLAPVCPNIPRQIPPSK